MRSVLTIRGFFYMALVGCLCTAGISVYLTVQSYRVYQQAREASVGRVEQVQRSVEDYQWLTVHHDLRAQIQSSGGFGTLAPWAWAEYLSSLHDFLVIDELNFELSPALTKTLQTDIALEQTEILVSGELLHDGMLISMLKHLTLHAPGVWFFESIEVSRIEQTPFTSPDNSESLKNSLVFKMVLVWISIELVDDNGEVA